MFTRRWIDRSESGFTLAEVLVVSVITLIIIGISIPMMRGVGSNVTNSEVIAAARTYASAVEAYRVENGTRAPQLGGAEWPVANDGPINLTPGLTGRKQKYLRSGVPDVMLKENVPLSNTAASSAQKRHIEYRRNATGTNYSFIVKLDHTTCYIGVPVDDLGACGT